MMVNKRRGEIAARLDGKEWRLCLTLGALAELETAFCVDDLVALGERFSSGKLSAKDMIAVITAGLRGAGNILDEGQVALMEVDGGIAEYADIIARLLVATFEGSGERATPANP